MVQKINKVRVGDCIIEEKELSTIILQNIIITRISFYRGCRLDNSYRYAVLLLVGWAVISQLCSYWLVELSLVNCVPIGCRRR